MAITVLDTATAMRQILTGRPEAREEPLRAMYVPAEGMYRYFPGKVDLGAMHRMSFGSPLDHGQERTLEALDRLERADAWTRLADALEQGVNLLRETHEQAPDITVLLVLGDPEDKYFAEDVMSFSGNGSVTGFISLTVWPSERNLTRLEAAEALRVSSREIITAALGR